MKVSVYYYAQRYNIVNVHIGKRQKKVVSRDVGQLHLYAFSLSILQFYLATFYVNILIKLTDADTQTQSVCL